MTNELRPPRQSGGTDGVGRYRDTPKPARDFGPDAPPQRYPDPDIVVIDPKRFKAKVGNTAIKRLHTGCLWAEGPAWNAQGQYLVWSDIPNNRQLRYLEDGGGYISDDFRKPTMRPTATRSISRGGKSPASERGLFALSIMGQPPWSPNKLMASR